MVKVYGIDLGTTYSVIATLNENGMPEVIQNYDDSSDLLASAVYFPSEGDPVVGEAAKSHAELDPDRVFQFVKREIGKDDAQIREFNGVKYGPIEISALILKRMKEYAETQGHQVKNVVITCPAYFGRGERAATEQAGIIAGMNVLNIVNEPTAAALNYCCSEFTENRKIMVYDLGGCTFDITLFDFSVDAGGKTNIDVIETGGSARLGGVDWDERLYDYICELYTAQTGVRQSEMDGELRQKIRSQVENVKKNLSHMSSKSFIISYAGEGTRLEPRREKFEELTRDLVERTMDFVRQLLGTAKLQADDIDLVLLVGGSTRMPMVKAAVEGMFPGKVRIEQPDLAVAKGAALAAFVGYKENKKAGKVKDKLNRSMGPGIIDGDGRYVIDNLLFVGDELPAKAAFTCYTRIDNQSEIKLVLFENTSKDRDKHVTPSEDINGNTQPTDPALMVKKIGVLSLKLPPGTHKASPIRVLFCAGETGLEVSAANVQTGEKVNTVITSENTKNEPVQNRLDYDFFDLTHLPFDPPEKAAQKLIDAINKAKKELDTTIFLSVQQFERDETAGKTSFLDSISKSIFNNEGKLTPAYDDLAKDKVKKEIEKLRAVASLLKQSGFHVITEGAIRGHQKKTMLSREHLEDLFRAAGFTIISTADLFKKYPRFPTNVYKMYAELEALRKSPNPRPNTNEAALRQVKDLYDFAAYMAGEPEKAAEYRGKSTPELKSLFDGFAKAYCIQFDNFGWLCSSLAVHGKIYVFDSEDHRRDYEAYLKYTSPSLTQFFSTIRSVPSQYFLEPKFAEACIKEISTVFEDYEVSLAIYNKEAGLKDEPYIPASLPGCTAPIDESNAGNPVKK
ncbi:MAG: Hsp70 family protein [Spirochaetaceae bacterium]|jgi:molecular chaperone DnaK (HSP70)|nr:Hsp70 family protein [Spirochaetaceae bacterium]